MRNSTHLNRTSNRWRTNAAAEHFIAWEWFSIQIIRMARVHWICFWMKCRCRWHRCTATTSTVAATTADTWLSHRRAIVDQCTVRNIFHLIERFSHFTLSFLIVNIIVIYLLLFFPLFKLHKKKNQVHFSDFFSLSLVRTERKKRKKKLTNYTQFEYYVNSVDDQSNLFDTGTH